MGIENGGVFLKTCHIVCGIFLIQGFLEVLVLELRLECERDSTGKHGEVLMRETQSMAQPVPATVRSPL